MRVSLMFFSMLCVRSFSFMPRVHKINNIEAIGRYATLGFGAFDRLDGIGYVGRKRDDTMGMVLFGRPRRTETDEKILEETHKNMKIKQKKLKSGGTVVGGSSGGSSGGSDDGSSGGSDGGSSVGAGGSRGYSPATPNQQMYFDLLRDPNVHILAGIGPAGCGKTLFACTAAIHALRNKAVERIVITRPLVSVDEEELGFLPGSIVNKMDPWTRPIFDIFKEFYSVGQIHSMIENGVIEISPLAYMRGRTFKRAFIIADEMQNSSPTQMLMVLTRIGHGSKLVITGDLKQSDRSDSNGLGDFIRKLKVNCGSDGAGGFGCSPLIRFVEMNSVDVQRSQVVSSVLNLYYPTASVSASVVSGSDTATHVLEKNSSTVSADGSAAGSTRRDGSNDAAIIPSHLYKF
jgi:phosphate starvation-inducible PhoH-like protein